MTFTVIASCDDDYCQRFPSFLFTISSKDSLHVSLGTNKKVNWLTIGFVKTFIQ